MMYYCMLAKLLPFSLFLFIIAVSVCFLFPERLVQHVPDPAPAPGLGAEAVGAQRHGLGVLSNLGSLINDGGLFFLFLTKSMGFFFKQLSFRVQRFRSREV